MAKSTTLDIETEFERLKNLYGEIFTYGSFSHGFYGFIAQSKKSPDFKYAATISKDTFVPKVLEVIEQILKSIVKADA